MLTMLPGRWSGGRASVREPSGVRAESRAATWSARLAGADGGGRREGDVSRIDLIADERSGGDLGGGADGGEVLAAQAGLGAVAADVVEAEGAAGDDREGEGGAEDLAAAFALGAVDEEG